MPAKVLIVTDHVSLHPLFKVLLRGSALEPIIASDLDELTKLLTEGRLDEVTALVSDVNLQMGTGNCQNDGYHVFSLAENLPRLQLRVLLTAYDRDHRYVQEILGTWEDTAFRRKPFDPREILQTLQSHRPCLA